MALPILRSIQDNIAAILSIDLTLESLNDSLRGTRVAEWLGGLRDCSGHATLLAIVVGLVVLYVWGKGASAGLGSGKEKLTEKEIDDLVDEWQPEPLVTPLTKLEQSDLERRPTIVGSPGLKVKLSTGRQVTNLASHDTFNLVNSPPIRDAAIRTLRHYGVGACGPPGFYGTKDVDIQLERDIANFLGVQASIVYAQSFATITSVIPAFAKNGDVVVADIGVSWSIVKGLQLSRCRVKWYAHNDVRDLERVLEETRREMIGKKLVRGFIVTEAIFAGSGEMIDLPEIIKLKHKYKYRLILDETHSFPIIGPTCRGITEHQNVNPKEVDILVGSLSHSLCNVGGFCAGSFEVVEHQRISSSAYVFSAALPAMYSVAASVALDVLKQHGHRYVDTLKTNITTFRSQIEKDNDILELISTSESPTIIISFRRHLVNRHSWHRDKEDWVIQETLDEATRNGLLITKIRAIDPGIGESTNGASGYSLPRPAMKICISTGFSVKDMDRAGRTLRSAAQRAVKRNC